MDGILEFKGQLQKVYAQYSKYIDKIIQFILALFTFYMINHDIGFMHMLTNPVITFGLYVLFCRLYLQCLRQRHWYWDISILHPWGCCL